MENDRINAILEQIKIKKRIWETQAKEEINEENINFKKIIELPEDFNCPICYEPMSPPYKKPISLYPCGHSICEECLNGYQKSTFKSKCPFCNIDFTKKAINYSLMKIIENITNEGIEKDDFKSELEEKEKELLNLTNKLNKNIEIKIKLNNDLNISKVLFEHMNKDLNEIEKNYKEIKEKLQNFYNKLNSIKEKEEELKDIINPLILEKKKLELELN